MVYFSYLMAFIFTYCVRGVAVSAVVISFLEDFTRNIVLLDKIKMIIKILQSTNSKFALILDVAY